jgi:hypothetical protein
MIERKAPAGEAKNGRINAYEMTNTTPLGRFRTVGDQDLCQSAGTTVSSLAHLSSCSAVWMVRRTMGPISLAMTSRRGFRRSAEKAWTMGSMFSRSMRTSWFSWPLRQARGRVVPARKVACKVLYAWARTRRKAYQHYGQW